MSVIGSNVPGGRNSSVVPTRHRKPAQECTDRPVKPSVHERSQTCDAGLCVDRVDDLKFESGSRGAHGGDLDTMALPAAVLEGSAGMLGMSIVVAPS